jgi:hypothetical protein
LGLSTGNCSEVLLKSFATTNESVYLHYEAGIVNTKALQIFRVSVLVPQHRKRSPAPALPYLVRKITEIREMRHCHRRDRFIGIGACESGVNDVQLLLGRQPQMCVHAVAKPRPRPTPPSAARS